MTWQEEDADANRQGLTIAEMEELGGPGMGGCPAGPTEQSAPQPGGAFAVRSADKTSLKVNWEPATPQPGAAAVTGYSVEAIGATTSATGQQDAVGARVGATSKGAHAHRPQGRRDLHRRGALPDRRQDERAVHRPDAGADRHRRPATSRRRAVTATPAPERRPVHRRS